MAFDHREYATEGLYPGLVTTRSVANLGAYKIEVIIEPEGGPPGSAGGAIDVRGRGKKDKYKVTILVSYKLKKWSYERVVSKTTASVIARLSRQKLVEPEIEVDSVTVIEKEDPTIEVHKK